jgi:hypothetical protein
VQSLRLHRAACSARLNVDVLFFIPFFLPFGNQPPLPEQTDGRRVLELDTGKWSALLRDRALPLALEGLENARDLTPGSVVALHRNIDAGVRGGAQEVPVRQPEAVAAFRGQNNLHLFVTEAQATSLAHDASDCHGAVRNGGGGGGGPQCL